MTPCPRELAGGRVLRWLSLDSPTSREIDSSPEFEGHQIAGVAICHIEDENVYYVFGCDKNWNTLTDTWHKTLVEAQGQADHQYSGFEGRWVNVL